LARSRHHALMSSSPNFQTSGPVVDVGQAQRTLASLQPAAERDGWAGLLADAWPALEPVFGASSYLAAIVRRSPDRLRKVLTQAPDVRLAALLSDTAMAGALPPAKAGAALRSLKADLHLVTALCDLGGLWNLEQVTGALTRFADAALAAALSSACREEAMLGRLKADAVMPDGYFCVAMGKYGAFELNYSSDIDYSVFYEPDALPLADGVDPSAFAIRLTQTVAQLMQDRTEDGYVFRVDLRLRPDPSATPVAIPVAAAMTYYETLGQNWERAAFIKARACAGDIAAGEAFLAELQPFIWRKNLDFAAIADIHSIKRQIHVHKVDERLDPRGADLKLGRGGIREIEFYVQTQQLILGGRDKALQSSRTIDALATLAQAGHVAPETAVELTDSYRTLRALEHRAQMIADQQTHKLPEADGERRKIAALYGVSNLRAFDAEVRRVLVLVNRRYGELFAEEENLSSRFGSLVFTGVEDDPETLATLQRMGFSSPAQIAATIRAWHHGRINATRSARGRELFTRLAPRLLEAVHASGAPDAAFQRFGEFFAGLTTGVQVQSLFLAQPKLFQLVVDVLAFAPKLAAILARKPAALDALLDQGFFAPLDPEEIRQAVIDTASDAADFEAAMDAVRRAHREQAFRIGVQLMGRTASAAQAGPAFTALAEGCIAVLGPASLAETERVGGAFPGQCAIIALGKCGSGEMTAASDLDLMLVYGDFAEGAASEGKGWWAETFYGRLVQRLVAALSAPTAEGGLYEVDLKLRPFGSQGAVAVSLTAFADYYTREAETWEHLALTRARVVWATQEAFAAKVSGLIEQSLRAPRDAKTTLKDTIEMRKLMEKERPPSSFWDAKLAPGGLVDIEFVAQYLQIAHAADGAPLRVHTGEALAALGEAGVAAPGKMQTLLAAWTLQQDVTQLLKVALIRDVDLSSEPAGFRALLAKAGGVRDFRGLTAKVRRLRLAARAVFDETFSDGKKPPRR